jgi:tetratricopeptide (TPR) repeat protein
MGGDIEQTLAASEQQVQLDPQIWTAHNNRAAYLMSAGRFSEALECARTAESVSPFGASQQVLGNQFWCLLWLGRTDEASTIVPRLTGDRAQEAPLDIAAASGRWATAESLATVLWSNPTAGDDPRYTAATTLAAVQASRGQVKAADQTLRQVQLVAESTHERTRANLTRWDRLRLALFSQGVAAVPEQPGHWDSTTVGLVAHGAWAAAAGDTTLARRLLPIIRARSAPDLARQGFFGPTMVEGWLAARTGRWQEVIRLLGPAALQGEAPGYTQVGSAPLVRWLVAEAYEQLGNPDSAAAYFERAIAPLPLGGREFAHSRMAFSFGHRRLALVHARRGRLEEAKRHWEIFSATFTRPDPEMAPLVEEARAAIASADAMARSARR